MQKIISLVLMCALLGAKALGNGVELKNGAVNEHTVSFDISWDNSWNFLSQGASADGIWVFVKAKNQNGVWQHISILGVPTQQSGNESLEFELPQDYLGFFVMRQQGSGVVSTSRISFEIDASLESFTEIRAFAIEMVKVPEGAFYLGDGSSVSSYTSSNGQPLLITSEEQIDGLTITNPNGEFAPSPVPSVVPASYPKGYNSFWVMKYEVSQKQYVDFLNTLTATQQQNRISSSITAQRGTRALINQYVPDSTYRNGVVIDVPSTGGAPAQFACNGNGDATYNGTDDALDRAVNFLSWVDLAAFLDWAALRPITEFEFEKVCRGSNVTPVAGEMAWGTPFVVDADNVQSSGTPLETVTNSATETAGLANIGNVVATGNWGLRGPLRTGFAAGSQTTRLDAGAAYYGVMELSGNVWELTVKAGSGGEQFNATLGDGELSASGDANQSTWPSSDGKGIIYRGGGWGSTLGEVGSYRDMAISDRFYSHLNPSTRRNTSGGRGGR